MRLVPFGEDLARCHVALLLALPCNAAITRCPVMRRPDHLTLQSGKNDAASKPRCLPEANVSECMANADVPGSRCKPHHDVRPAYRALFLGAGPQMQCGVGQFTRLLCETIEKLEPGSSTTLTLTRSEGSFAEIWRAVGIGAKRGLQLSDRGLEARDRSAAAGARFCAAARRGDRPDPARMGRPALAAPHHLSFRRCCSPIPS